MIVRPRLRHAKRALLILAAAAALTLGALFGSGAAAPAQAATSLPCDIYAAAGTPCVAAHSTTRALLAAYNGALYQVKRSSDGATTSIGTLSAGGYANAAAQDAFCSGTYCTITEIFDQSGHGNNLTIGPAGGNGGADIGANAAALPVMAGGHRVYGVYISPGMGYRNDHTAGVATGSQPQGAYMVASGSLPTTAGYKPMHQEGAIILGVGGHNSNNSAGSFFEGVMTAGYPGDAADNSVQANVVSVGYASFTLPGNPFTAGARIPLRATTACCTGTTSPATPAATT